MIPRLPLVIDVLLHDEDTARNKDVAVVGLDVVAVNRSALDALEQERDKLEEIAWATRDLLDAFPADDYRVQMLQHQLADVRPRPVMP